ncbi:methyl-accepting chemotaxis protein [Clostridium moutaii]|uniref:methyl-accepting chemotaxis protein n=1 Tax=Clostridium moutaii TaxID=3240932 RepID=UPI00350FD078
MEAAKAKESGSGFAVVANEIRKLAKSSSEQASEIQNIVIVNDIKDEITSISISMNNDINIQNKKIIDIQNIVKKISIISENTTSSTQLE